MKIPRAACLCLFSTFLPWLPSFSHAKPTVERNNAQIKGHPINATSTVFESINVGQHSKRVGPTVAGAVITLTEIIPPERGVGYLYYANIFVNSLQLAQYQVLVDTGSGLFWLGAQPNNPYPIPGISVATGQTARIDYGSGDFVVGPEFTDDVVLSTTVGGARVTVLSTPALQSIVGIDDPNSNIDEFLNANFLADGILGIGPAASTRGLFMPAQTKTVPNAAGTLFQGNALVSPLVAFFLTPPAAFAALDLLIWGGTMPGLPVWTSPPIFYTVPAGNPQWQTAVTVSYGVAGCPILPAPNMHLSFALFDSGSPVIFVSSNTMQRYVNCAPGLFSEDRDDWVIAREDVIHLQSLSFTFGGNAATFQYTPDAQLVPNTQPNQPSFVLSIQPVDDLDDSTIVLGTPFFHRFYLSFGLAQADANFNTPQQIGVAPTEFTTGVYNQFT